MQEGGLFMQYGALGMLALAFLLVLKWMLTNQTREMRSITASLYTVALTQVDMHRTLMMHDAQVRGVNPSAGEDMNDAHEKAYEQYTRAIESIDKTAAAIKDAMGQLNKVPVDPHFFTRG